MSTQNAQDHSSDTDDDRCTCEHDAWRHGCSRETFRTGSCVVMHCRCESFADNPTTTDRPAPADCPHHDWVNAITWRICRTCGDVDSLTENECADGGA